MITEAATIQKLALRSDLPRLKGEGFFLFAQLEPQEQTLPELDKWKLLSRAFVTVVAEEERNSEGPLPAILPRSYKVSVLSTDWIELECACDLADDRCRSWHLLGWGQWDHLDDHFGQHRVDRA